MKNKDKQLNEKELKTKLFWEESLKIALMKVEPEKGEVSKEKFEAYEGVRKSGQTNMFNIPVVIRLAAMQYLVDLTKEECIYIMKNYKLLNELEEVTEKAGYGVYTKPE